MVVGGLWGAVCPPGGYGRSGGTPPTRVKERKVLKRQHRRQQDIQRGSSELSLHSSSATRSDPEILSD